MYKVFFLPPSQPVKEAMLLNYSNNNHFKITYKYSIFVFFNFITLVKQLTK